MAQPDSERQAWRRVRIPGLVVVFLAALGCSDVDRIEPGPAAADVAVADVTADAVVDAVADTGVDIVADGWDEVDVDVSDGGDADAASLDSEDAGDSDTSDAGDSVVDDAAVDADAQDANDDDADAQEASDADGDADADADNFEAGGDADVADVADVADTDAGSDADANSDAADASTGADASDTDASNAAASNDADADAGNDADAGPPPDPTQCPFALTPSTLGCKVLGPCKTLAKVTCVGNVPTCDYAAFAAYQVFESTCDGLDNDCNGGVDDNLPSPLATTWPQVGACKLAKQVCSGAAGWVEPTGADLKGYEKVEASCDLVDNDCNGATDDITLPPPVGAGTGVCATASLVCTGGYWMTPNPSSLPNYEAIEVSCDGLDNNCDGETDGAVPPPADLTLTVLDVGVCTGAKALCIESSWIAPDYAAHAAKLPGGTTTTYQAVETTCDGLDNDCDGQTDEGLPSPPAAKQNGVCSGSKMACTGSGGFAEPNYALLADYHAGADASCDGLDNDCDGETDEDVACPQWQRGGGVSGRIDVSVDGSRIAVATRSGVGVVRVADGVRLASFFDHADMVDDVAFSPDGVHLASVGRDHVLRIRTLGPADAKLAAGKVTVAIDAPNQRWSRVDWDVAGGRVVVGSTDGWVRVVTLAQGSVFTSLKGHEAAITALSWQRKGALGNIGVASGDSSGKLRLWRVDTGAGSVVLANGPAVTAIATTTQSARLLVGLGDGSARVVNGDNGQVLATLTAQANSAVDVAFAPDGAPLLLHGDGTLHRYAPLAADLQGNTFSATAAWLGASQTLGLQSAAALSVVDPGGSGGAFGGVFVGSPSGPPLRVALTANASTSGAVTSLEDAARGGALALGYRVDLGLLVIGGGDGLVWLRDVSDGSAIGSLSGHVQPVVALATRPVAASGGAVGDVTPLLASGGKDKSARLWTLTLSGKPGALLSAQNVKTFGVGIGWPAAVAFSSDAAVLWAGGLGSARAVTASGPAATLGNPKVVFGLDLPIAVDAIATEPGGTRVALGLIGGALALRILNGDGGVLVDVADLNASRRALAWRPGVVTGPTNAASKLIALAGGVARLQLVATSDGALVQPLLGHIAEVVALDWAAGGQRLLSGDASGSLRLWQIDAAGSAKLVTVLTRHCPWPCTAAGLMDVRFLDAAGTAFVSAADDGGIIRWRRP